METWSIGLSGHQAHLLHSSDASPNIVQNVGESVEGPHLLSETYESQISATAVAQSENRRVALLKYLSREKLYLRSLCVPGRQSALDIR